MGVQLFDVVSITSHQYEEQTRLLEKIAWIQSHKVRRPLANIMGLISLMEKSQSNSELLPMLSKSAEELNDVIQSIVTLASRHKDF
jgi:signal transduction histidine kinase